MTDEEARAYFSSIFDEHYHAVLTFCRRRTRNIEDAADATSATFLTAWRRIDVLAEMDTPIAWLYSVAYRTVSNQRRSANRARAVATKAQHQPRRTEPDIASAIVHAADLEAARAALDQLSDEDQELIRLSAFEALTHEEIGIVIDIDPSLVRSRLYRARQRLRTIFEERVAT